MTLATKAMKRPTPTIHSQKRIGAHQKQNKHFMKTYWPYLPLFMLAAVLVIFFAAKVMGTTGAVVGSVTITFAGFTLLL